MAPRPPLVANTDNIMNVLLPPGKVSWKSLGRLPLVHPLHLVHNQKSCSNRDHQLGMGSPSFVAAPPALRLLSRNCVVTGIIIRCTHHTLLAIHGPAKFPIKPSPPTTEQIQRYRALRLVFVTIELVQNFSHPPSGGGGRRVRTNEKARDEILIRARSG